jgi:hypothetical protein
MNTSKCVLERIDPKAKKRRSERNLLAIEWVMMVVTRWDLSGIAMELTHDLFISLIFLKCPVQSYVASTKILTLSTFRFLKNWLRS